MVNLKVGDIFPDMGETLNDSDGSMTNLEGKNAIIYFYPKDNTPGCTKEAKDFRDYKEKFDELNTEIVGISTDTMKSHQKFADKYNLNFTLLSDKKQIFCTKCGVKGLTGKTAKRTSFLIDKEGAIKHIWNKVSVRGHAEDVLKKIKELKLE